MSNSLVRERDMNDEYWDKTQEEIKAELRLAYLQTFVKPNSNICPECYSELTTTEDEDETICTSCGLIEQATILYVGVQKIKYPYGLLL